MPFSYFVYTQVFRADSAITDLRFITLCESKFIVSYDIQPKWPAKREAFTSIPLPPIACGCYLPGQARRGGRIVPAACLTGANVALIRSVINLLSFWERPSTEIEIDGHSFSKEQCDELFAAVLAHDDIDLDAELPDAIHLDYTPEQLTQCYRICRQLWKEGVDRAALGKIVEKIFWHRSLSPEDQLAFKDVRARFKHLRFAYVACDERHRYPRMFHWLTAATGYLQDAFKNEQGAAVGRLAIRTRLFLTRIFYALISREIDQFQPSTTETFKTYVRSQIGFLQWHLAREKITSKEFHEMRKVISRLVALYDNLKILYPSPYHVSVSKYLSTINGLMGAVHDEMIIRKFNKTQDYYADAFEMPTGIRQRLLVLTERYKVSL